MLLSTLLQQEKVVITGINCLCVGGRECTCLNMECRICMQWHGTAQLQGNQACIYKQLQEEKAYVHEHSPLVTPNKYL